MKDMMSCVKNKRHKSYLHKTQNVEIRWLMICLERSKTGQSISKVVSMHKHYGRYFEVVGERIQDKLEIKHEKRSFYSHHLLVW